MRLYSSPHLVVLAGLAAGCNALPSATGATDTDTDAGASTSGSTSVIESTGSSLDDTGTTRGDNGSDDAVQTDGRGADSSTTDASTTGGSTTDASTTGGSTTDASTTDASTTGGSTTGGSTTDGSTTGGSTTDASTTDASTTGASTTDGSTTDGSTTGGQMGPLDLADVATGIGGFIIDGESSVNRAGYAVSDVGDLNGDGLDDLVLSAPGFTNVDDDGRSFVVFGKATTTPVELEDIADGIGGFVVNGQETSDALGRIASGLGDVNGDGIGDIILGAPSAAPTGEDSGRSYVVFGKANTAAVELTDIVDGIGGFALNGEAFMNRSGHVVNAAGDVNGDGLNDIVVGSYRASPNGSQSGRGYLVFGKADTTAVELTDITAGVGGFVLNGEAAFDRSSASLGAAGDLNGDGLGDLVVGASGADPNGSASGRSYVVFGKADTLAVELVDIADGLGGFVLDGESAEDGSGAAVSGAGDVNADGIDDIIIGAPLADSTGDNAGRSYVVFGKADTVAVELADVATGIGGFVLNGETALDWSGIELRGAGDVNADGLDDVIVGAEFGSVSHVVFGKLDGNPVDLADLNATMFGLAFNGEAANDFAGRSVSGAGDVNGDGVDDIIVGAPSADPNGNSSGRSYVVFGVP